MKLIKSVMHLILAGFICFAITGMAGVPAAGPVYKDVKENGVERSLSFYNTHTGETLTNIVYWRDGRYSEAAIMKISTLLRDHRRNEVQQIDAALLDLLWELRQQVEKKHKKVDVVYQVISGYRSPETNAMLRASGGGQAKKSRHMHGDAIDIRVKGVKLEDLRNTAWCMQRGGVGYYAGSDFIHVDTHNVRYWNWSPDNVTCPQSTS